MPIHYHYYVYKQSNSFITLLPKVVHFFLNYLLLYLHAFLIHNFMWLCEQHVNLLRRLNCTSTKIPISLVLINHISSRRNTKKPIFPNSLENHDTGMHSKFTSYKQIEKWIINLLFIVKAGNLATMNLGLYVLPFRYSWIEW